VSDAINLTVNQFCAALPCGRTKAYELLGTGEVEAIKLGNRTLIPKTEVPRLQARLPRFRSGLPDAPRLVKAEPDLNADHFESSSTK
jgi:excisionase family DNA binding protein